MGSVLFVYIIHERVLCPFFIYNKEDIINIISWIEWKINQHDVKNRYNTQQIQTFNALNKN